MFKPALAIAWIGIGLAVCRAHPVSRPGDALEMLRAPLTNELSAATNSAAPNRSLVNALNGAIALLGRASESNLTVDIALLSQIAARVAHTTAVTNLAGTISAVTGEFLRMVRDAAFDESNRLAVAFPSANRSAANRSFAALLAALDRADAATNSLAAISRLKSANGKRLVFQRLVTRALAAAPPPARVTAAIAIDGSAFAFRSSSVTAGVVGSGAFTISSTQRVSIRRTIEVRELTIEFSTLQRGPNLYAPVRGGVLTISNASGVQQFVGGGGTANLTWDPDRQALAGSFTNFRAICPDPLRMASAYGTFSTRY